MANTFISEKEWGEGNLAFFRDLELRKNLIEKLKLARAILEHESQRETALSALLLEAQVEIEKRLPRLKDKP